MRNLRFILILFSFFTLYSSDGKSKQWSLRIFFNVKGMWDSINGGRGNYELKMLFEGWLFRDNGDYGISYVKDSGEDKIFYWRMEIEKSGKTLDLSREIKPYFEGGISIRNDFENLILLRIHSEGLHGYPLVFPSSKGFEIIEGNNDYDRFIVAGSNKLSFRDEDLKKEFTKKTEWEWKKKDLKAFSYHKVKASIVIKPKF